MALHILEPEQDEPVVTLELPVSAARALRDCYHYSGYPAQFGYDGSLVDEVNAQLSEQVPQ